MEPLITEDFSGSGFVIIGALAAFPKRLARREILSKGGFYRRNLSRRIDYAVFGHRLIDSRSPDRIRGHLEEARAMNAEAVSERGFLQMVGLAQAAGHPREISLAMLSGQSGLDPDMARILALFDAFHTDREPFGFQDLVAAKQYCRLLETGLQWPALIRALRLQALGRISGLRLESISGRDVVTRDGDQQARLDGQYLLPLPESAPEDAVDTLFADAEDAEKDGNWRYAAELYRQCILLDRSDPAIPFNLSHALMQLGDLQGAAEFLHVALKIDPAYAEAWYNLGTIARKRGNREAERRHLEQALNADADYPDALYNLAHLEYEHGDNRRAETLWERYIELDPHSKWTEKAKNGLRLIRLMEHQAGNPPNPPVAPDAQLRPV